MVKSTGNAKALFVSLLLLTAPQIVLACVWYPHTAITDVEITAPADGAKICASLPSADTEVACSCTEESDTDKRVAGETTYPADDLTYTWSASAGSWKNGVNTGRNVTWIAPDTPSGSVNGDWIKVTITDAAVIPPGESGDRNDDDETATIHVTVVKSDLDIAGTTEENEETLGGFVAVNDDDDDDDDVVDKDDASVAGEDDLITITLQQVLPAGLPGTDKVKITWTQDAKIDVFEGSNKSTPVSSGAEYQLNTLPKTLYVEGDVVSGSARDIEMKLEYLAATGTCEDKVKVTVVKVDLDIDSDNDDRNGPPDRNDAEEDTEASAPGKVIIMNEDDDDSDGDADNSDTEINGAADSTRDLAEMVAEIKPSSWGEDIEVALRSSNYGRVRVFEDDGTYLLGPDQGYRDEHIIQPGDLTNGILDLLVEGVETEQVTLSLIYRKANGGAEICRDEVVVTCTNNLHDELGLDWLSQHKDTVMLCAFADEQEEECSTSGAHAWDCDHGAYSINCEHCNSYCARASIAMINKYYGGSISQDRLSYEVRSIFSPDGNDLGHDRGMSLSTRALSWSLSLNQQDIEADHDVGTSDSDWYQIVDYLVSYRPVAAVIGGYHAVVIGGFKTENDTKKLQILDPLDSVPKIEWTAFSGANITKTYTPKYDKVPDINGKSDEASISSHTDNDGIVDFDEEERSPVDKRFSDFEDDRGYVLDEADSDSNDDGTNDYDDVEDFYDPPQ